MVHNSRFPLKENIVYKLNQLFFEVVSRSFGKEDFLEIIGDILSPTEQTMVSKRIAIIYLLIKDIKQSAISHRLKVSRATVAKFALLIYMKDSKIKKIINALIAKKTVLNFLHDIFADLLIQPGLKKGHWQLYINQQRAKEERKMIDV